MKVGSAPDLHHELAPMSTPLDSNSARSACTSLTSTEARISDSSCAANSVKLRRWTCRRCMQAPPRDTEP